MSDSQLFNGELTHFDIKEVRPYSSKELCGIYGISYKTLRKWLQPFQQEIGDRRGRFYTVLQVETIFCKLGLPYRIRD
ncbi:MAG: hypothetical protein JWP81_2464 [Ferruginibacter sp.]|nr:hypothetical protein [Ferruginibacter sp.]